MAVSVYLNAKDLPDDKDFIFKPEYPEIYIHLINANFYVIYVRNDTDRPIKINRKNRLRKLIKIKKKYYYYVKKNFYKLAILKSFKSFLKFANSFTDEKNINVAYGIKIYKNIYPEIFEAIIFKYFNLFKNTGRIIDVFKKY